MEWSNLVLKNNGFEWWIEKFAVSFPSAYYLTMFLPLNFDTFAFSIHIHNSVLICETDCVKIIIKFRKISIRQQEKLEKEFGSLIILQTGAKQPLQNQNQCHCVTQI